jgi:hypothetical protein
LCFDVKSILDNTLKSNRLGLGFGDAGWIRVKYMGCGKIDFEGRGSRSLPILMEIQL